MFGMFIVTTLYDVLDHTDLFDSAILTPGIQGLYKHAKA